MKFTVVCVFLFCYQLASAAQQNLCSVQLKSQTEAIHSVNLKMRTEPERVFIMARAQQLLTLIKTFNETSQKYLEKGKSKTSPAYRAFVVKYQSQALLITYHLSYLIVKELERFGYKAEVFQSLLTEGEIFTPHRVRITSFPDNLEGKMWRRIQEKYQVQIVIDPFGEIESSSSGQIFPQHLRISFRGITGLGTIGRMVQVFHEIVHLEEDLKIRDGKPGPYSMLFYPKNSKGTLPEGYEDFFGLDEILSHSKEVKLYLSKAYSEDFLWDGYYTKLKGNELEEEVSSLRKKIIQFVRWSMPRVKMAKESVENNQYSLRFDKNISSYYAEVKVVEVKRNLLFIKTEQIDWGVAHIYVPNSIAILSKSEVKKYLLSRLQETDSELKEKLKTF